MFQFKQYCWVLGTTSFRVDDLNKKNELQMGYLKRLFANHPDGKWQELQKEYYELLTAVGFKNGLAKNPEKDARELTSGLADIGLVDRGTRKITEVGEKLLQISEKGDFESDNVFGISKDSYLYFLQFLKLQVSCDGVSQIKPFIYLLYFLCKLGKMTREEFTYLLPICTTDNDLIDVCGQIMTSPDNVNVDQIIFRKMMSMDNYRDACHYFVNKDEVDRETIEDIGMNRKSRAYDSPVFDLYNKLHEFWENKRKDKKTKGEIFEEIKAALNSLNNNQKSAWMEELKLLHMKKKEVNALDDFSNHGIFDAINETTFRLNFFKAWHLCKWKSTLEDYYDLNKRYFILSDVITYENECFQLSETARIYFSDIIDRMLMEPKLQEKSYEAFLGAFVSIDKISPLCSKTNDDIATRINTIYGCSITGKDLEEYLKEQKNDEFIKMIDRRFPKEKLIEILRAFKTRDDAKIRSMVSEEASPSTSFEYILGIIWYNLSGRKGRIEDCFNLTLNSSLLPVIHAGGNMPDLQFVYDGNEAYPPHTMLMEATLAESMSQRHMEWEPVSRHLENQLVCSHEKEDYTIFISSQSYYPTIKSFRAMKNYLAGTDESKGIPLKIIPLDCDLLISILSKELNYQDLYGVFEQAFESNLWNISWFDTEIKEKLA